MESWSSWSAASTSSEPTGIHDQYVLTTGSWSSAPNIPTKLTSASTNAAPTTPGPTHVGIALRVGQRRPQPR